MVHQSIGAGYRRCVSSPEHAANARCNGRHEYEPASFTLGHFFDGSFGHHKGGPEVDRHDLVLGFQVGFEYPLNGRYACVVT